MSAKNLKRKSKKYKSSKRNGVKRRRSKKTNVRRKRTRYLKIKSFRQSGGDGRFASSSTSKL